MKNKLGFTLVELLAVVMILSILTALAVPQYTKSIQRANAANALISLKTVYDSAKRYYSTYGTWPTSFNGLDVKVYLNEGSANRSGDFEYIFDATNKTVSACRVSTEEGTASYCLQAAYKKPGANRNDTYLCDYSSATRYKSLCQSLGECTENSTQCTIR